MGHPKLIHSYNNFKEKRNRLLVENSQSDEYIQKHVRGSGISIFKRIAVYAYSNKNILEAKNYFFNTAMFAEYVICNYSDDLWPGVDVKPYVSALLSDNMELISRFSRLDVSNQKWSEGGGPSPFNDAIQGLLSDDAQKIERAIVAYKKRIEKEKQLLWSRNHLLAIESILKQDKAQLEEAIMAYEHKTLKKAMINADICEEVLSFWGLLWAKIGWIKDINPIVDSERVPVELLHIEPLKEYTIPYWFLRDFYREQGVDWRYDPVYPELQDWDNDPENPDRGRGGFFKRLFS